MTATQYASLSAAVGMKPRPNGGKDPKNNPKDVSLVRELLALAGSPIQSSSGAALVRAIMEFQSRHLNIKHPDGIVDVGKKTYMKLVQLAQKGKKQEEHYIVAVPGQSFTLTPKDFQSACDEVQKRMQRSVSVFENQYKGLEAIRQWHIGQAQGADGFIMTFSHMMITKFAGIDHPQFNSVHTAFGAIANARSAVKGGNFKAAAKLIPIANRALEQFDRDMYDWINKYYGKGERLVEILNYTRDGSFIVAEYLMTAKLMISGKSPKVARASAGAMMAFLKSTSIEIGEHLVDPNRSILKSSGKVLTDTAGDLVLSGLLSGLGSKCVKDWAKKTIKALKSSAPLKELGAKITEKFVIKLLSENGQKVLKEGIGEAITFAKNLVKKGRIPTLKEIEKQVMNFIGKHLSNGIFKCYRTAVWKSLGKIVESYAKNPGKISTMFEGLGMAQRKKVLYDIIKSLKVQLIQTIMIGIVDSIKSSMSDQNIQQKALAYAMNSKEIQCILRKEVANSKLAKGK